jgi:glycosyltransferase involved in cell wall biosynthesis
MKILFSSASSSEKKYAEVFEKRNKKIITPTQNFYRIILDGLANFNDVELQCVTALPVSSSTTKKFLWRADDDKKNNRLKYHYLPFFNGKFVRLICLFFNSFFYAIRWFHNNNCKECYYVADALLWVLAIPMSFVARCYGVKTVGFLTDMPEYANIKHSNVNSMRLVLSYLIAKLSLKSIKKYDAYIFVSNAMSPLINSKHKPEIVVEAAVERQKEFIGSRQSNSKRIFLYAGGIYEKYGLKTLVEAFIKANLDAELHLYGDGDYADILKSKNDYPNCIKYMGCLPASRILIIEESADVLVNPRPVRDEYTKFSFPSKTTEYLSSGRLVLSTKLPGIPDDYYPFIMWFDDDSEAGLIEGLSRVSHMSDSELKDFGLRGKAFCLSQKNNEIIGRKIINFLESIKESQPKKKNKKSFL